MRMKKFINNPENLTPELLKGFAEAHKELVTLDENRMITNNELAEADGVTIMAQDDSGREPVISGFVGEGMADISVAGDVFAAPGPQACLDAVKLTDKSKDVLYIILDHTGDMLIGNLTVKKCAKEGLDVVEVVMQEDIANTPRSNTDDRRGLMECILTYKIAGIAATEGRGLEEVAAIAQRFADNMATLAVAVSGATHPTTGSLPMDLGEDEMEIDMRQHEEGGGGRRTMEPADETAKIILDSLLADLDIGEDEKITLIFNGTSTTTLVELFIIYRRCVSCLREKNIEIVANYVGKFLTVRKQAGFQTFVARVDDELLHY